MKRFAALLIIFMLFFPATALAADFNAELYWDGQNIIVHYGGFRPGFFNAGVEIWATNESTGETYYCKEFDRSINKFITELQTQEAGNIPHPQEYEKWIVEFKVDDQIYTRSINCWTDLHPETGEEGSEIVSTLDEGPIPIFMQGSWEIIMFWYYVLASLSGAFIFLIMIRSGYQHMMSPTSNPGLKSSFTQSIERCIIGIVIIIAAPYLVNFLIQINDALVSLFANTLDYITTGIPDANNTANTANVVDLHLPPDPDTDPWLSRIVSWPFQAIINLINNFFGLHPLGDVIFNGHLESTVLTNDALFTGDLKTGNPFTEVLLNLALMGFTLYFNAVYTIRRWVVIAVMAVTPLIIWIWVLTSQRNVIELWLSELVQTIFMQTWHALTFGIFFSILCFGGGALSLSGVMGDIEFTAQALIQIGKWVAGVGGIVCVGVIISQAFQLAVAQNEQAIEEVKTRIKNALIGLIVLGLSLMIASFLTADEVTILNPVVSESEVVKITFWQLFFVLFTIIPVSKMLSMIFMSILARFGTVDEHGEASKASGMIGGLAALGQGAAAAAKGKAPLPSVSGGPSGPSQSASSQPSVLAEAPGIYEGERPGIYEETPGIYEGDAPGPPGVYQDSETTSSTVKNDVPDRGLIQAKETNFLHTLNQSRAGLDTIAESGEKVGFAAGMFAGAPQGIAAFMSGATKIAAAPVKTAYDLGMAVRNQTSEGGITGRTTSSGAVAQTITAVALSPFGSHGKAAVSVGRQFDRFFGGVDMYNGG